jgi:hypothetical protein
MSGNETILIRASTLADTAGLARLAALDSSEPLTGRALVAEVDGQLRAALPLDGGRPIADPFAESEHVVELLRAHARALARAPRRRRGRLIPLAA